MSKHAFRKELEQLINRESMENGSDTPDFLLAEFLTDVLDCWDRSVNAREKWYGRDKKRVSCIDTPFTSPENPALDNESKDAHWRIVKAVQENPWFFGNPALGCSCIKAAADTIEELITNVKNPKYKGKTNEQAS